MDLILAEQLLLLLLDDDKGSDKSNWGWDPGLAGAVLLDLTAAGAIEDRDGKLAVVPGPEPQHPVLAAAHQAVAEDKPRDAKGWVGRLPKDLKPLPQQIAAGLVSGGVLSQERRKVFGVFNATRFPQVDPRPELQLRERLRAVLLTELQPTPQDAMLVALMEPYDLVKTIVPKDRRKEAKARAGAIAEGGATGKAVGDSLKAIQAAIVASTLASVTAATTATMVAGS